MPRKNPPFTADRAAQPASAGTLIDNFGRTIDYVRLSVTDRCNLRCIYCMPSQGIQFLPRKDLLTYEEMTRLLTILAAVGVSKVRITGGEPFVRKDLIRFLWKISRINGIRKLHITTNGVLTAQYLSELKEMGIAGINLSLDTLDRTRFQQLTRRDNFDEVMSCFHRILDHGIPLKLNTVMMEEHNTGDIIPMAELTRRFPVDVRYIEEMPFNGTDCGKPQLRWDHRQILRILKQEYPDIYKIEDSPNSTSMNYKIPNAKGTVGIIAGFSRTFCGSCNRIRINARGMLQTCLYGKGVLDVKTLLRSGVPDEEIINAFTNVIGRRFKDGWAAQQANNEHMPVSESMSAIGG